MKKETITYACTNGVSVEATFTTPDENTSAGVILLHGWQSSRLSERNVRLAEMLAEMGIASLAIDLRGHGKSGGDIETVSVSTQVEDVYRAYEWLRDEIGPDLPIGIVGASIGASTALRAMTSNDHDFQCGVLICPRSDFSGLPMNMYFFGEGDSRVENRAMLTDGQATDFYLEASKIKAPVLIIHGDRDQFIPLSQTEKLLTANPQNFQLHVVPGGDHRMQAFLPEIVRISGDFLVKHLK